MNNVIVNEQQLQIEVDKIKAELSNTKDIYREVCMLLFFRYGITPTANKLYQYVRRGSMSAPAVALNKFWLELREKSRVRIERPDIPANITAIAGDLIAKLWSEAQKVAQDGFSELVDNAASEVLQFKLQAESANQNLIKTEILLKKSQDSLKSALKQASETDYLLSVNAEALSKKENAFKALKLENDVIAKQVIEIKLSFSKDLEVYSQALLQAERRYDVLEKKLLVDVDRSRQEIRRLEKDIQTKLKSHEAERSKYIKDLTQLQNYIGILQEKLGIALGRLDEVNKQFKSVAGKLSRLQKSKTKL